MTWQKGESGNPGGVSKAGRQAVVKVRVAISKAIDSMKDPDNPEVIGVVRLAAVITEALQENPISTLKALSSYMPKDVLVDQASSRDADKLTDAELARIIAEDAVSKASKAESVKDVDIFH